VTEDLISSNSPSKYTGTLADLLDRVRWLRGRALVQRDVSEQREHTTAGGIVVPDRGIFDKYAEGHGSTMHRGKLLAHGPPGTLGEREGAPVVPWDCAPGDEVLYVYGVALQKLRTLDVEGLELVVVAQEEIQAVVEGT
jgi:co-chaperonin GroES (HSP10)